MTESPAEALRPVPGNPEPMPWRKRLADWPDDWRERWGLRANELEDAGLAWRDAEARAFAEVRAERLEGGPAFPECEAVQAGGRPKAKRRVKQGSLI